MDEAKRMEEGLKNDDYKDGLKDKAKKSNDNRGAAGRSTGAAAT